MSRIRLALFSLVTLLLLLSLSSVQSQQKQSAEKKQPSSSTDEVTRPIVSPGVDITRLVAKAQSSGTVRVIVGLSVETQPEGDLIQTAAQTQRRAIAQAQSALLDRLKTIKSESVKRFTHIPFLALEVDAEELEALRKSPEVTTIEEDEVKQISLAESVPLVGAPAAWAAGFSGTGQAVAILDTGVDKTHPFLSGKVVSEACYSTNSSQTASVCPGGVAQSTDSGSGVNCGVGGCEHGTHVAGIAAGKSTTFSGVARDANIVAIQVFSRVLGCSGSNCVGAYNSDILLGLQRVFELRSSFNIAAVNLSLGGGSSSVNCDASNASTKASIDNLRSVGIATVVASGNESSTGSLSSPACISTAISVGSTGDGTGGTTADRVSTFSNSASFLNLLAPGESITSSVPGGNFSAFRGTSMSTPHVVGAWAVMKSKTPTASVPQVLQALTDTGLPITDTRNSIVKPRIRVDAAATALSSTRCNFAISPLTQAVVVGGGSVTVNVTAESGCAWTARSNVPWLTISSGGTGVGNGAAVFTAAANTVFDRIGTLLVAGNSFTVTQPGVPSLAVDDGGFETSSGIGAGGNSFRVNRLTPTSYPTTINSVAVYFSSSSGLKIGDPLTVIAGVNPGGTATINGVQFAVKMQDTVRGLDQFNVYQIPALTAGSGDFVVGVEMNHAAGLFPFAIDTTTPRGRSYRSLDGITFVPIETVGTAGNYGMRALPTQTISCPIVTAITPTAGKVGDPVTITGSGFTGVTSVKFPNNVVAQFTINSDTSITAITPDNISPGPILISRANCADVPTPRYVPAIVTIAGAGSVLTAENCTPANGSIDPDETVVVNFSLRNTGTVDSGPLTATLQVTGGVGAPSAPQNYGVLTAGGAAVARSFTFTAGGQCGGTLTATLSLQDGTVNRGTATFSFPLGALKVTSSQNFDSVTVPALPTGWTSTVAQGTVTGWATSATTSDSQPNNVFVANSNLPTDIRLDSPSIPITTTGAQISFRNNYNLEAETNAAFDGGVLEIAIGTGSFTDILVAGGSFVTGGYNRTLITDSVNVLKGRQAWSGNSNGYVTTLVNLPATATGQSIKLRWRLGSDDSVSAPGWRLDNFQVFDGRMCETVCSGIPCPVISVAPATLPAATLNTAYNQALTATNGATPYTFSLSAGVLPNGMSLSPSGVISGSPTRGGSFDITVKATDNNGCVGTRAYTLVVNCPTISLSPISLASGTLGSAYSQTFTASGGAGPYTFAVSAGTLPAGLTLTAAGALSGTPTRGGSFSFTVRATDASNCSGTRAYSLVINCVTNIAVSPATLPDAAIGAPYSQTLTASGGAAPYTFAVTTGTLPSGITLSSEGAFSGVSAFRGVFTFTVSATDANGCSATRNYTLTIPGAGSAPAGVLYVLTDSTAGNQIYGYGVNETTGALTLISGFPISTGGTGAGSAASEQMAIDRVNRRLYVINDGSNTVSAYSINSSTGALVPLPFSPINLGAGSWATIAVHPSGSPLLIGDTGSSSGSARLASYQIISSSATAATGSPFATGTASPFSIALSQDGRYVYAGGNSGSVFAGFEVNATNGGLTALTGSPFNAGGDIPLAYATDATGRFFTANFRIGQARVFTTASGVPTAVTGNPFTSGLTEAIAGLLHPNGFYMVSDRSSNRVGVYRVNGGGSATTLTAVAASPFSAGGSFTSGLALNQAGTFLFAANGNSRNLTTFSVNTTTGALGSPSTQASDTLGSTGRLTGISYLPLPAPLCPVITFSPSILADGAVAVAYSQTITASPAGTYTYAVTAGTLPSGLSLNSTTGLISGTPTTAGVFNFIVRATNAANCVGAAVYTINIAPPSDPRVVRVVPINGAAGGTVGVPVEITSQGNENSLSFSLTFDPTRLNSPFVTLGGGAAGAQLTVNSSQSGQGRLGVILSLPAGEQFGAGNRQLVVVHFTIPSNVAVGATAVGFGDQPIRREVVDASARSLTAIFASGQVMVTPEGYEADVAPRPNGSGDGNVTLADVVQIGRFVSGLDIVAAGSEFQRADCAPLNTLGDGRLSVADWAQAGRYVAGLDAINRVGGPTEPIASAFRSQSIIAARQNQQLSASGLQTRQSSQVRLVDNDQTPQANNLNRSFVVALDAQDDEHALGFSLSFNPKHWRFVSAVAGEDARDATLSVNAKQAAEGHIGVVMATPVGRSFGVGEKQLLVLRFVALAVNAPFAVNFGDFPTVRELASVEAKLLPARFTNSIGTLANVSAASFGDEPLAREQIVSAFGQGLAAYAVSAETLPLPETLGGTRVVITDSDGAPHVAPLFFVSPTQINYLIPATVALGPATVMVYTADGAVAYGLLEIAETSPSLFTANADGQGVAAAVVLRVKADGSQIYEPVVEFDSAQQRFVAKPIQLGNTGEQVFLLVYGTGLRGQNNSSKVTARIGDLPVETLYAGAQGDFAGLDQVNLRLPDELAGHGEVEVVFSVDGKSANTVRLVVR